MENILNSPPASGRRSCEHDTAKIFATIKVPHNGNLLDKVAHLRDGKIQRSATGITSIQRLTEVIVFDLHWLGGEKLHDGLLIDILEHIVASDKSQVGIYLR